MSKSLVAIAALGAATAEQMPIYAAYDLSVQQIESLTAKSCFRGQYGQKQNLSLLTCATPEAPEPFATVDEDSFMCVIERNPLKGLMDNVASEVRESGDRVLYTGRDALVIMGEGDQSVRPKSCCALHYGKGQVDNAAYVPKEPIVPTRPTPDVTASRRAARLMDPTTRASIMPNPIIQAAVDAFDKDSVEETVRFLATDNQGTNSRITRNSYAIQTGRGGCLAGWDCANDAVDDVVGKLTEFFSGYSGNYSIDTSTFRNDMCDNIVLTINGRTSDIIVSGSHLDSRNTGSGSTASGAAPGADDNASGSAVHLEMARIIGEQDLQFENTIQMMWFCGEEQGLIGSAALASAAVSNGDNILGMFNSDMIGYTDSRYGETLSFMTRSANAGLTAECKAFSQLYVPDLAVGDTTGCCSDQQSFHSRGFRAVGIFETPTPSVVYPQYHRVGDAWDNGLINYNQISQFGKSIFASMLEYADPIA